MKCINKFFKIYFREYSGTQTMLAPDVANMYPHKIPFRRQSFGSSGTAFAAPWSRFPPFGTPHGPPRSPVSSLRSGSLKVPASAALRNFRIVPSAKPSGIRPPLTQPRHQPSGPWSEKFVTKRPTPRYAPHIGKLPLAAALSPTL